MSARILVIDDEEMVRTMQVSLLTRQGYHCLAAADAENAARLATSEQIDLALIDINMPGHSGIRFLQELRALQPDVAALMVTAVDDLDTAMFCMQAGADDYIVKPFAFDRLLLSVRNALEKRRLTLENRAYQSALEENVRLKTAQLERALQDSGLKADSGSLSFNLGGRGHEGFNRRGPPPGLGHRSLHVRLCFIDVTCGANAFTHILRAGGRAHDGIPASLLRGLRMGHRRDQ